MYRSSGITVRELLDMDGMKEAKVIAGKQGLNRVINKINVMEVPDIVDWVEEGEFLLTTAYPIKDELEKLEEIVIQLNKKSLAGLGIKTKRYIKHIPQNVIDTANKLGFPLIEIPYEISYSTIIVQGLTEVVNNQTSLLKKIDKIHNKLLNVMLNGGSLEDIARALYESMEKNTLAIKEYVFETNAIFCNEHKRGFIENILEEESIKRRKYGWENNQKLTHERTKDIIDGQEVNRITIPIYTKERDYGCIYIWEDHKPVKSVELTVIEAATPIITLDLLKKLSVFETESKYKIEFFEDLFSSDVSRHTKALERASYFGFDSNLSHSAVVISIDNVYDFEKYGLETSNHLHQINIKLLSIIQRITNSRDKKIICGNKSNKIIALYGSEHNADAKKLRRELINFTDEIIKHAEYESIHKHISIGIGRNYNLTDELWKSYREANRAIECIRGKYDKKIIHYDDLGIYRILSYEELQPELKQFYREVLAPLVKYDKDKGTDLVETMRMFFKYGGNLKKISDEMYTHYNTIIYRMQRIKDITGTDFEDYDDRLNFQIALKILEMLEK
ncbi:MAG: PucR family transcriptional regulator ligand-binding domain-containing protein [Clostridiaceae bacterium]|nr:PucR family transcriptional regulator ligand-binding domain-containing protein [Clostridiaceae bacterium]